METFKLIWLCKATNVQKTFVFTGYKEQDLMGRIIFANDNNDNVLTISNDSFHWMITRPNKLNINEN